MFFIIYNLFTILKMNKDDNEAMLEQEPNAENI
jgi:hypothetical protein